MDNPPTRKIVSFGLIVSCIVVITLFIDFVHAMPGKLVRKRNNPQAEAIEILSLNRHQRGLGELQSLIEAVAQRGRARCHQAPSWPSTRRHVHAGVARPKAPSALKGRGHTTACAAARPQDRLAAPATNHPPEVRATGSTGLATAARELDRKSHVRPVPSPTERDRKMFTQPLATRARPSGPRPAPWALADTADSSAAATGLQAAAARGSRYACTAPGHRPVGHRRRRGRQAPCRPPNLAGRPPTRATPLVEDPPRMPA